jgi:long-chain acyl-CoA synthetase
MENKYWRKNPIKEFNTEQTMYSLVTDEAKNDLDLEATGFMGASMKYGELFESADDLAKSFNAMGVKEGDNVAILTISMPLVQQCLLSLSKIGATMSWIDLRAKEKDLINYINNGNCKVVVVFEDLLPLIEKIAGDINAERVIVCSPKDYLNPAIRVLANLKDKKEGKNIVIPSDDRFVKFSDFIKEGKHTADVPTADFKIDRPSLIIQSSGSTGKPKQIVHTEHNFNSEVQKMSYLDLPLYKGQTMHVSVPPFIIYGLGNSVYCSLVHTMKAEMTPFVDENTVYNDLGKFDVSFAAPLHYRYIYEQLKKLRSDIDQLQKSNNPSDKKILKAKLKELTRVLNGIERAKVFVSGGDKISAEELIEMQHAFDKTIVNGYGNNECLGATIVSPMYANKPGSIGVPMRGVDIKLVNPETGEDAKEGEMGELYVSSDNLFVEYLNNPEETAKIKVTDENGKQWVKSGDLCVVDSEGYVFPKGRNRRLIKKDAFKIAPDTIEEVIISLPFVKECVVVGVDDEKFISVPMAFVELEDNISIDDVQEAIRKKCEEELPDYEIPTYFEQIDEMLYTGNGKHDFRKLEELGNSIVKERLGTAKVLKK